MHAFMVQSAFAGSHFVSTLAHHACLFYQLEAFAPVVHMCAGYHDARLEATVPALV